MNVSVVQSIIDAMEKPAIFIDLEYRILAVNPAYRDTYENEVIVGKSRCFEISHRNSSPCDQHGEDCPMEQCNKTDKTSSVIHIHDTPYGKTYCDILMKPIKDENGITTGFLEVLDRIKFASNESNAQLMIGASEPFKKMLNKINRSAKSDIAVLLHGETGTGKELVAKAVHESSFRAEKPFVIIECTGLNENLFESELFGHEKGAFTGATHAKKGLIEMANGGTVFFDEIADVPLAMQVKLLRLLETHCYRTVGGIKQKKADFRLICASHKNLLELVASGEFRKDLYYRIAGFPIMLPSLAQRRSDIPILAEHFLKQSELHRKRFSQQAMLKLSQYDFPGNIRELRSIVEHSALLANEDIIEVEDLPELIIHSDNFEGKDVKQVISLDEVEKQYLSQLCFSSTLPVDELAQQLEVSPRTLYRKLQKYGLKYDGR
ncbi:MAG: sigma 54-interacting transcriptional regulator [Aliiglaciecola sp.]|uniref:sigma-54 interaction domain-containing protein n=1 Tax=Aliiglaciecola sp. TaxID=1872441 RepID=UPI0032972ADC